MHKRLLIFLLFLSLSLSGCNYSGPGDPDPSETSQNDPESIATPTFDPSSTGGGGFDPSMLCEPNEGFSTAAEMGNGTYALAISGGDGDWFRISAAGGTPLVVRIEFQHATGDLDLELYDDQNALVAHSWTTSDHEEVTLTPTSASSFFARVLGYQGAAGNYNLIVSGADPQIVLIGQACPAEDDSSVEENPLGDLAYILNFEGASPTYGAEILDAAANNAGVQSHGYIWQLGTDPWMPPGGHSEPNALITVIGNDYPNNTYGDLIVGPFDFSQVASARLEFNLYYEIESGFDGLRIMITTNNGTSWSILTPEQGYPGNAYIFGGPAFTGSNAGWQVIGVDLGAHLFPNTHLGFQFLSDTSITVPGAAVDDISIWINGSSGGPIVPPIESNIIPVLPYDLELIDPDWIPKLPRFMAESDLNCREGNHTGFPILTLLESGTGAPVKAVNPERTWLYVLHPVSRILCWVWHEGGSVEGMSDMVPELPNRLPDAEISRDEPDNGLPAYCMVSPGGSAAPECKPCFEGATPGTACTP
jgi:hypothetical protein